MCFSFIFSGVKKPEIFFCKKSSYICNSKNNQTITIMKQINTFSRSRTLHPYHLSMAILKEYTIMTPEPVCLYDFMCSKFGRNEVHKLRYSHTSQSRGYRASGNVAVHRYSGRFGFGYIVELPSNISRYISKNYHDILYFINKF